MRQNSPTFDPEKFNLDVARLRKGGLTFEVVVDPDKAIAFKEGTLKEVKDVLKYEKIFSDAQKGLLAPENSFEPVFGTKVVLDICYKIIREGEIHITAEKRKQEMERKRKKIIAMIHRNGVDPRTDIPHTPARIEMAFNEAKIHVDEFKPVEVQVKEILKKLQPILPIRFETKEIEVYVQSHYAHPAFGYIQKIGKVLQSTWGTDQSWIGVVEIPGGLEEELYDNLNKITHGTVQVKIVGKR